MRAKSGQGSKLVTFCGSWKEMYINSVDDLACELKGREELLRIISVSQLYTYEFLGAARADWVRWQKHNLLGEPSDRIIVWGLTQLAIYLSAAVPGSPCVLLSGPHAKKKGQRREGGRPGRAGHAGDNSGGDTRSQRI